MPDFTGDLISALLGGGFEIAGTAMQNDQQSQVTKLTNDTNKEMALQAQNFSAQQAQLSRDYTTRMSNTAHQREMEDYRRAGLNPILSAGGGASTPSSPSPTGTASTAQQYQVKNLMSGAFSSAKQAKLMDLETQALIEGNEKLRTSKMKDLAETQLVDEKKKTETTVRDNLQAQSDATRANSHGIIKFNELMDAGGDKTGAVKALQILRGLLTK